MKAYNIKYVKNKENIKFAFSEGTHTGPERKSVVFDKYQYICIPDTDDTEGKNKLDPLYILKERKLFLYKSDPL